MSQNKYIYFFFCIFIQLQICTSILAQDKRVDSLLALLKTDKEDTNKIKHLNSLALEFRNNNPDTAIRFAKQALALSEKMDFQSGIAESYLWLGTALTNLGKYGDALSDLSRGLDACNGIGDNYIPNSR